MKKQTKVIAIIVGIFLIIGGVWYMNRDKGNVEQSKKSTQNLKDNEIEKKIAEKFAEKYFDPNGKEISEITFYKKAVDQSDATGNRSYYFYVNGNKKWKVGASVKIDSQKVWAFGSDFIDLNHKKQPSKVENIKIKSFEDYSHD